MCRNENEAGVLTARRGVWRGKEYIFTHRNPANSKIWGEDILNGKGTALGAWVPSEQVRFVD